MTQENLTSPAPPVLPPPIPTSMLNKRNYDVMPRMGFFEAVNTCFSKYVNFKGRARRSEYWWFFLFTVIFCLTTSLINAKPSIVTSIIYLICVIAVFLPMLAVSVRRFHDINMSGWWAGIEVLIGLLPTILEIFLPNSISLSTSLIISLLLIFLRVVFIVLYSLDSHPNDNKYGESIKYYPRTPESPTYVVQPQMNFFESIVSCYKKMFTYSGRARRSEFWWFALFTGTVNITYILLSLFDVIHPGIIFGIIFLVFFIFPLAAATIRRLHDINQNGNWLGLHIICFLLYYVILGMVLRAGLSNPLSIYSSSHIFAILIARIFIVLSFTFMVLLIILCCIDSDRWTNENGESPKYVEEGLEEEFEDTPQDYYA